MVTETLFISTHVYVTSTRHYAVQDMASTGRYYYAAPSQGGGHGEWVQISQDAVSGQGGGCGKCVQVQCAQTVRTLASGRRQGCGECVQVNEVCP